jgi:hypothetical protein
MAYEDSLQSLADLAGEVPSEAAVHALERPSPKAAVARLERLVEAAADATGLAWDRRNAEVRSDRTVVGLPDGGHAVAHHASGAVVVATGLAPMHGLFSRAESDEELRRRVLNVADRLALARWVRDGERLGLERVWRIMAGAGDAHGTTVPPVLCRAVGAFRHYVDDIPVWGPAAAALTIAGDGGLDRVALHLRSTSGRIVDRVRVVEPVVAARDVVRQLAGLRPELKDQSLDFARPTSFDFGYLSLPRRKTQELLAPVYMATFTTQGDEPMNHLLVAPATEKDYLAVGRSGAAPPILDARESATA